MKRCNNIKKILSRAVHFLNRSSGYEVLPTDKEPQSPLLDLPLDVLRLILAHLQLESQACLALTCNPLHRALGFVLKDKQLAWPRLLAAKFPLSPYKAELFVFERNPELPYPRNELLHLLKDNRWKYGCCNSLKLHRRHCVNPGSSSSSNSVSCGLMEDVVDLCACLALTFSDKVKLIEWLKTGQSNRRLHRNVRGAFEMRLHNNKPSLVHDCSVTSQPDALIHLSATATLDADDCLIFTTRYHVYWQQPHRAFRNDGVLNNELLSHQLIKYRPPHLAEPVFLCPHIHAIAWLHDYYMRTKDKCRDCDTRYKLLDCTNNDLYWAIQSERNLGSIRPARIGRWFDASHSR